MVKQFGSVVPLDDFPVLHAHTLQPHYPLSGFEVHRKETQTD